MAAHVWWSESAGTGAQDSEGGVMRKANVRHLNVRKL